MNGPLFAQLQVELDEILDKCEISSKEIQFRKERICQSFDLIQKEETLEAYALYHQRAHEIESIPFLKHFGCLRVAEDSRQSEGCDFVLNEKLYIECVCSSPGNTAKNHLNEYMGEGIFDYAKKLEILNIRFTSSLCDKVKFYNDRVGKSIPNNMPYIIFISPGSLSYEWFGEKFGMALLDVLVGRGNPSITINTETGKVISTGYTHKNCIKKHNDTEIDCNLFLRQDFDCVSAILLTTAPLGVRYSSMNTFLFINPNASCKIRAKDFWGIVYWKVDKEGYYTPRRKGKVKK